MLSDQLLPAAAISLWPSPILGPLSIAILAAGYILRSWRIAVLSLAGRSYLAILLIAGTLILAVLDAVLIAVSSARTWAISILCIFRRIF